MPNEVKMLPCPIPWCAKSKPELMQGGFRNGSFVVRCKTCGCETPRFYDPRFAISKWNTRPTTVVTDEVVERVAYAIRDGTPSSASAPSMFVAMNQAREVLSRIASMPTVVTGEQP